MKHTLVAAFATLTDANRTRGDLMARGIPREQIHAVGAESADIHAYDAPYSTSPDVPVDRHEHESKVAHFFKSLFGHEPHEQHRHYATAYPDAVRRGALVIAVDVVDEDQLARARDALEYNGAIDIDERSATWGDGATPVTASTETLTTGYPDAASISVDQRELDGSATPDRGQDSGSIPGRAENEKAGRRDNTAGRVRIIPR